ncbi:MAG TPA: DivIVA domain-containing protein [Gaiellaceae bacterium]|nr:DivIVA domain-containing protein [Gaiellaceae bacterium]
MDNATPQPANADEIRAAELPRALRGYDRAAVDELVARMAETLTRLEAEAGRERDERQQLERRVAEAEAARSALETRLRDTLGEREQLDEAIARVSSERDEVARVIEEVKSEREERIAYTDRLERELTRFRELERSLTQTVVVAEHAGNELRAHAEKEATLLLEQARNEARTIILDASAERERVLADLRAIRAMLQAAQATLDESRLSPHDGRDAHATPGSERFPAERSESAGPTGADHRTPHGFSS